MVNQPANSTRVFIRFPCEIEAEISFSGGGAAHLKKALISNISTTGIQILSPSFIATGQKIQASFKVPGHSTKTTFTAEVMRIESLQTRMVKRYPYALGAKFIEPEAKQEKQITRFIFHKLTCAAQRKTVASLLFLLAAIQFVRTLLSHYYSDSNIDFSRLAGLTHANFVSWLIHPIPSALITAGISTAAVFVLLNRKNFSIQGVFWTSLSVFFSIIRIIFKRDLLMGSPTDLLIWTGEAATLGMEIATIVLLLKLVTKLRKANQLLNSEKISSAGLSRPTFTIL